jgi:hypothetical protein
MTNAKAKMTTRRTIAFSISFHPVRIQSLRPLPVDRMSSPYPMEEEESHAVSICYFVAQESSLKTEGM